MAKKKEKGTYHFGYEHTDKKKVKRIVAACDDSKQPEDHLLKLPTTDVEFDYIVKLADSKALCSVCDRLFRSYLTGREHGFAHGVQKIIEKVTGVRPPGSGPTIHDRSPSGLAH